MKKIDITGKKYNYLTAVRFLSVNKKRAYYWLFKCKCGKYKKIKRSHVVNGSTKTCGTCILRTGKNSHTYKHGLSKSKFYRSYNKIHEKCYSKNNKDYKNYGARGIKSEWKNFMQYKKDMYKSFLYSIKKNGIKNTTIDRIDNNSNYSKLNCKWSTYKQQQRNRRNNVRYLFKGKNLTIPEWSEILKIPIYTIYNLKKRKGISVPEILKRYAQAMG